LYRRHQGFQQFTGALKFTSGSLNRCQANCRLNLKQLVAALAGQIQCPSGEFPGLIQLITFVSDIRQVQRGKSLVVQHGLVANRLGEDLPVQLLGLLHLSLPVEKLTQYLECSQHPIDILSRTQQRACFQDFILRLQDSAGVQPLITQN
jgi:hypothetical protein